MTAPKKPRGGMSLAGLIVTIHGALGTGVVAGYAVEKLSSAGDQAQTVGVMAALIAHSLTLMLHLARASALVPLLVGPAIAAFVGSVAGSWPGTVAGIGATVLQWVCRRRFTQVEREQALRAAYRGDRVGPSVRKIVAVADRLAGTRWAGGYDEWLAHLHGDPDKPPMGRFAQMRCAYGFLHAAIKMRLRDAGRCCGRLLDRLIATPGRVFTVATLAVGSAAAALIIEGRSATVALTHADSLAAIGVGVWSAATALRRIRRQASPPVRNVDKPSPIPPPTKATPPATRRRPSRTKRGRRGGRR